MRTTALPPLCPLAQTAADTGQQPTLVLIHHLSGLHGEETLSALLVLASFEQPIQLCLAGDAVSALSAQSPLAGERIAQMLRSLAFYDLLPLWVTAPVADPVVAVESLCAGQLDRRAFAQVLTW